MTEPAVMTHERPGVGGVSVVIPTTGRDTLAAAVDSALSQTHEVLEVLVCFDLAAVPDGVTFTDRRVRSLCVGPGAGGNGARMAGIEAARGEIIALLDDDDVWELEKLELQMQAISEIAAGAEDWVCGCRVTAVMPSGEEIWPRRVIRPPERPTPFLARRRAIFGGQGFLQSSMLVFPARLAKAVPRSSPAGWCTADPSGFRP